MNQRIALEVTKKAIRELLVADWNDVVEETDVGEWGVRLESDETYSLVYENGKYELIQWEEAEFGQMIEHQVGVFEEFEDALLKLIEKLQEFQRNWLRGFIRKRILWEEKYGE